MNETWRDIENTSGQYQVSNLGRVKSLLFGKERILKPLLMPTGYDYVSVLVNGVRKLKPVHWLVLGAFLPNENNMRYINHLNGDKRDNRLTNLEYCKLDNCVNIIRRNKAISDKLRGRRHKGNMIPVAALNDNGEVVNTYPSMTDAANSLPTAYQSGISVAISRKIKRYGFYWQKLIQ
ncbi:MAG: hypothetical protein IIW86_00470 [Clostridia bacterium]|nr:hypothetical protein [Clostridia bacterium]